MSQFVSQFVSNRYETKSKTASNESSSKEWSSNESSVSSSVNSSVSSSAINTKRQVKRPNTRKLPSSSSSSSSNESLLDESSSPDYDVMSAHGFDIDAINKLPESAALQYFNRSPPKRIKCQLSEKTSDPIGWQVHHELQKIYTKNGDERYMVYFIVLNDTSIPWRKRIIYVGQHKYKKSYGDSQKLERLDVHQRNLEVLFKRQWTALHKHISMYRKIEHKMLQYQCGISFCYYEDIGYPPHIVENAVQSVYSMTFGSNHLTNSRIEPIDEVAKVHAIMKSRKKVVAFVSMFINEQMFLNSSITPCDNEFSTGAEYGVKDDDVISVLGYDFNNAMNNCMVYLKCKC